HLAFRGTLYRPGRRPIERAEITAQALVTSAQQIELAFTESLESLFCGAGEEASHTTFEGEVEVAFTAAYAGAPPIAGTLRKVVSGFRPADQERRGRRGARRRR